MATTAVSRRAHTTHSKEKEPATHSHDSDHGHGHAHSHSHSDGFFSSLVHTHGHGEGDHGEAEHMVQALKGGGDPGSRITLIGLGSNVVLTISKGAAGWYMNSAALLADAGHCAGDLIGDIVTLVSWRLSRKPPSERYPYGYGKFEVLGTTVVSLLLTGGALGIGLHSWALLTDTLTAATATMEPGVLHDIVARAVDASASAAEHAHIHAHSHAAVADASGALDPNAAWFAALGVVAKEWLYRATRRVAKQERSPVLMANAVHHRSDGFGSAVALVAILGNWFFPHIALDPIGGLVVSVLILHQGLTFLMSAIRQLTDAGVSPKTKATLMSALEPLISSRQPDPAPSPALDPLLAVTDLRAMRSGAHMMVDLVAHVPAGLSVEDAATLEERIHDALVRTRREVKEVRVKFHPVYQRP
ncbi:cation efflux protein [Epithele typhae]|uniref:cation efflux protein n=1 Tax=Epithele typhae TaxID=378194 RepID=UPI002007764D|nr:cation efflux protein [Epithele typhae]KAH9940443.1 cation efflux protein [Epithele typhae]